MCLRRSLQVLWSPRHHNLQKKRPWVHTSLRGESKRKAEVGWRHSPAGQLTLMLAPLACLSLLSFSSSFFITCSSSSAVSRSASVSITSDDSLRLWTRARPRYLISKVALTEPEGSVPSPMLLAAAPARWSRVASRMQVNSSEIWEHNKLRLGINQMKNNTKFKPLPRYHCACSNALCKVHVYSLPYIIIITTTNKQTALLQITSTKTKQLW